MGGNTHLRNKKISPFVCAEGGPEEGGRRYVNSFHSAEALSDQRFILFALQCPGSAHAHTTPGVSQNLRLKIHSAQLVYRESLFVVVGNAKRSVRNGYCCNVTHFCVRM